MLYNKVDAFPLHAFLIDQTKDQSINQHLKIFKANLQENIKHPHGNLHVYIQINVLYKHVNIERKKKMDVGL